MLLLFLSLFSFPPNLILFSDIPHLPSYALKLSTLYSYLFHFPFHLFPHFPLLFLLFFSSFLLFLVILILFFIFILFLCFLTFLNTPSSTFSFLLSYPFILFASQSYPFPFQLSLSSVSLISVTHLPFILPFPSSLSTQFLPSSLPFLPSILLISLHPLLFLPSPAPFPLPAPWPLEG